MRTLTIAFTMMLVMMLRTCAFTVKKHGRRTALAPLSISKSDYRTRSIDELNEMLARPPDPKKQALLQKLELDGADIAGISAGKTGAELRRQRKQALKVKTPSSAKSKPTKSTSSYAAAQEKPVRFNLGCGIEVLTAASLLDLVKSTAPYIFPESGPRVVIEEDEFIEDMEDYDKEEDKHTSAPLSAQADKAMDTRSAVEKSQGPSGWLTVLKSSHHIPNTNAPTEEQRVDYFALCMASHFATVATFVPTDVDSKIRGHCWDDPSPAVINAQFEVLQAAMAWDVTAVSKRTVKVREVDPVVPISGHNGEWLGVMGGAWGAFLRLGDTARADEVEAMMHRELDREAQAFQHVRSLRPSTAVDTALLRLAAILTHNVGDVDQGFGYWKEGAFEEKKALYARLAHERGERYGGEFVRAKAVYKELLSAEGHRNYPLRDPKCLRMTPDLMLPLAPWLEAWGRTVAVHPSLSREERMQVARQLLRGCDSKSRGWCVPNQIGYFRALQGMVSAMGFERFAKDVDKDCKEVLKSHDFRLHMGMTEEAFASKLGVRAREILDELE